MKRSMEGGPGLLPVLAAMALCAGCLTARAGIESGNTLALEFSSAAPKDRASIGKEAVGHLFFFRYMYIKELQKGTTNGLAFIRMSTVEPSSDMIVDFTVQKKVSLEVAAPLVVGDAVAVTGRIKEIGKKENTILLDPVIVKYKDRLSPKHGREMLYEVDPNARRGTDTSSGEERIIR